MPSSVGKKASSLTRRITEIISHKSRTSSTDDVKEVASTTPPLQSTTPSISSSPQTFSRNASAPHRNTIDDEHRLPVAFLPLVSTSTKFMKGLDVFGQESRESDFDFHDSPVEGEDNWFRMQDDHASAFAMLRSRPRSESKATSSSAKSITIGWVREDGFKPIGESDD